MRLGSLDLERHDVIVRYRWIHKPTGKEGVTIGVYQSGNQALDSIAHANWQGDGDWIYLPLATSHMENLPTADDECVDHRNHTHPSACVRPPTFRG